jgi:hypothetical protein
MNFGMDLDQQIQLLVDNAPQDGQTPQLVAAIAPVFKSFASRLRHPQYYMLQNLESSWIVTTLNHRSQPGLEKNVAYAFPTLQDVTTDPSARRDPQVLALPVPVAQIIFQLVSSPTIDSVIFFENPGNTEIGTEILRSEIAEMIQKHMQQVHSRSETQPPTDIA